MNYLKTILSGIFEFKSKQIVSDKNQIRQKMHLRKIQMPDILKEENAQEVFNIIESLEEFKTANNILLYWSKRDELPTHNFIIKWSKKKQILLPVVKDDDMLIKPFSSKDELTKGKYGIWEPEVQREYYKKIDLVIVPGVAFDKNKSRLGRGKGYYDKYFKNKNIVKIGIGFDFQLLDKIPTADFDIKMDKIITPNNIIE